MEFPVFRKYLNDKSYFKISSGSLFEELRISGKYYSLVSMETKTLPERNFINDMLYDYEANWTSISEVAYQEKMTYCLKHLQRMDY